MSSHLALIRVITVEPYLGAPRSVISHSSPFGDADVSDNIGWTKPGICATVPWIPLGRSVIVELTDAVQEGRNEKAVSGDVRDDE